MRVRTKKWGPGRNPGWLKKDVQNARQIQIRAALEELQLSPHEIARLPRFSEVLEDRALGGLGQVMEAMRLSTDPAIEKFLDRYDGLTPTQQEVVPWEAVAFLAEVEGRELLGAIILALRHYSTVAVKIVALSAHPAITEATVEEALKPTGWKERQMMHQALGFLAPPKGQTINVNTMSEGGGMANVEIAPEDIDMNELFPDLTETQKKLLPK